MGLDEYDRIFGRLDQFSILSITEFLAKALVRPMSPRIPASYGLRLKYTQSVEVYRSVRYPCSNMYCEFRLRGRNSVSTSRRDVNRRHLVAQTIGTTLLDARQNGPSNWFVEKIQFHGKWQSNSTCFRFLRFLESFRSGISQGKKSFNYKSMLFVKISSFDFRCFLVILK